MSDAPLNGFELIAALPALVKGMNEVQHWVVVVDRGGDYAHDRYAIVHTKNLHAPRWTSTYAYRNDAHDALHFALVLRGHA